MLAAKKIRFPEWKYYAALLLLASIAYWPLTLHFFTLKNDAISYFLPWRYQVSEAIQNNYFPFWSPYLYTGVPLHADIQSGVWNPIVFFISLLGTYNMTALQWETFIYIVIGGIGFFKLSQFLFLDKKISLFLALSYSCCSFMIDSGSFIPWVAAAAYIPFVFLYFLKILRLPSFAYAIRLSLAGSLLFLAGYTSFFIFTMYLLFFSLIILVIIRFRTLDKNLLVRCGKQLVVSIFLSAIICSPALISYIDFFPYYQRGGGVSLEISQTNAFEMRDLVSYIFPQAVYKLSSTNDITARDAYIGILPLIFIGYSLKRKFSDSQKIILVMTTICFFFSLGSATPIHALFYNTLPLINSFRHPATIRLFTSIGLLLLSGFGLNCFMKEAGKSRLNQITISIVIVVSLCVAYGLLFSGAAQRIIGFFSSLGARPVQLKKALDSSGFSDWVVIAGIVQLIFLSSLLLIKKKGFQLGAGIANMIVMASLSFPFTLISQHRGKQVDEFLNSFPGGFPTSLAWQIVGNKFNDTGAQSVFGYKNFYAKTISIQDYIITPTLNSRYNEFLKDSSLRRTVSNHRFVYSDDSAEISLKEFGPNSFSVIAISEKEANLHIVQQFNRSWKAFIDQKPVLVYPDNTAFMRIRIHEGKNEIRFSYRPLPVVIAIYASLLVSLAALGLLIYFRWKKS